MHSTFLSYLMFILSLCLCVSAGIADNITGMDIVGEVEVCPAEIIEIRDEILKLSEKAPSTWSSETILSHIQCIKPGLGTPVPGAIVPQSVKVRYGDKLLELGKDYLCDQEWGALSLGPQSCITSEDDVSVDYKFSLRRIDSLVLTSEGDRVTVKGKSHLTVPEPPSLNIGQEHLANVFIDYHSEGSNALILPVKEESSAAETATTLKQKRKS